MQIEQKINGDGQRLEFQAVVLSGGLGNRMYPLTDGQPKCLLPIANRPLLSFQLEILERSGFSTAIVVVLQSFADQVQKFVSEEYKGSIKVDLVSLSRPMGTAEVFREPALRQKLVTDFFVVSGDLITNVFLHYLADIHRSRSATLTVLLKKSPKPDPTEKKTKDDNLVKHFIGLDEDKSRLLMFRSASDVDDEFVVKKSLLRHHPNLVIHTSIVDQHLYLFSHWILDLLEEKKGISSIQAELLPYLIANQFTGKGKAFASKYANEDDQARARVMSHSRPQFSDGEAFRCYALIAAEPSYCFRANTVKSYFSMNKDMSSGVSYEYTPWRPLQEDNLRAQASTNNPKAAIGSGSIIGRNLVAGNDSSIKKSVVGHNVKIGEKVKIVNSIIFDNVVIQDDCVLFNCIVCKGAVVSAKTNMKDCQVGESFTTVGNTEYKNEALVRDTYDE